MNRVPQSQLDNLEREITELGEFDRIEITNTKGRIQVIKKSTRKISFDV